MLLSLTGKHQRRRQLVGMADGHLVRARCSMAWQYLDGICQTGNTSSISTLRATTTGTVRLRVRF